MKKKQYTKPLLLYTCFLFLASCYYPVYNEVNQSAAIDAEEPTIQEVQTMKLQPIKEYEKYITSGKRVYGIVRDDIEEIILLDSEGRKVDFHSFFTIDGMIYLSVMVIEQGKPIADTSPVQYEAIQKEYFFSQTGNQIDEEPGKDFPTMPESIHVTYSDNMYKITIFPYEIDGEMANTSRVIRSTTPEGYLMIDGFARVNNGIWFSVPVSLSVRKKGVYFWPDNKPKWSAFDDGRIW